MKIHKFIGDFDLAGDIVTVVEPEFFNQIKNVLKLSVGERVLLSSGKGEEALAEIKRIYDGQIEFEVKERQVNVAEPERVVTLYCSILKRENFELVVQKAVECGVKKIVPLISARTVKTGLKIERLEKIIKEASEQSGRGIVPKLTDVTTLKEALALVQKENGQNVFFDASGEIFSGIKSDMNSVGIFIGPEGGWTEDELKLAETFGCTISSLGKLILRGETAAVVASYLAVHG